MVELDDSSPDLYTGCVLVFPISKEVFAAYLDSDCKVNTTFPAAGILSLVSSVSLGKLQLRNLIEKIESYDLTQSACLPPKLIKELLHGYGIVHSDVYYSVSKGPIESKLHLAINKSIEELEVPKLQGNNDYVEVGIGNKECLENLRRQDYWKIDQCALVRICPVGLDLPSCLVAFSIDGLFSSILLSLNWAVEEKDAWLRVDFSENELGQILEGRITNESIADVLRSRTLNSSL